MQEHIEPSGPCRRLNLAKNVVVPGTRRNATVSILTASTIACHSYHRMTQTKIGKCLGRGKLNYMLGTPCYSIVLALSMFSVSVFLVLPEYSNAFCIVHYLELLDARSSAKLDYSSSKWS